MLTLTELIERASKVREVMIKESQRIKEVLQKAYDGAKKEWDDIVQQVGGKPEEISQDAEEIAKTCKTEVDKAVVVFEVHRRCERVESERALGGESSPSRTRYVANT